MAESEVQAGGEYHTTMKINAFWQSYLAKDITVWHMILCAI